MLECGTNYKGKYPEICTQCNRRDDEYHRLNECPRFVEMNTLNSGEKVDFQSVYSDNAEILLKLFPIFSRIWNTKNAHGTIIR